MLSLSVPVYFSRSLYYAKSSLSLTGVLNIAPPTHFGWKHIYQVLLIFPQIFQCFLPFLGNLLPSPLILVLENSVWEYQEHFLWVLPTSFCSLEVIHLVFTSAWKQLMHLFFFFFLFKMMLKVPSNLMDRTVLYKLCCKNIH